MFSQSYPSIRWGTKICLLDIVLNWRQQQNLSSPAAQPWSSSQSLRTFGVSIWTIDERYASRRFESSMMATGDHFRYRRVQSRRELLLTSWASRGTTPDLITTLITASLFLLCNWQRSGPDVHDRSPDPWIVTVWFVRVRSQSICFLSRSFFDLRGK
jgi:hypothetical protein